MHKLSAALLVFVGGFVIMVLEIIGARYLAKDFGGSFYVWVSQIGVILTALALGYFAGAYGFQIIGAVIPSATTEAADPSARQTAELLNIIKTNGVHAIFAENMASSKLAETLSKEAGVEIGPPLYTDALGPAGSPGENYLKMIRYNVGVFRKYLK